MVERKKRYEQIKVLIADKDPPKAIDTLIDTIIDLEEKLEVQNG